MEGAFDRLERRGMVGEWALANWVRFRGNIADTIPVGEFIGDEQKKNQRQRQLTAKYAKCTEESQRLFCWNNAKSANEIRNFGIEVIGKHIF